MDNKSPPTPDMDEHRQRYDLWGPKSG